LSLSGITYLGARRVDFEHSHANMLYEIRFGGREGYTTPITVTFRQDAQDKSLLSIQSAMDATGKQLSNLSMSLRTLEDELHWVDSGSIFD
jgi:hypothetical protein